MQWFSKWWFGRLQQYFWWNLSPFYYPLYKDKPERTKQMEPILRAKVKIFFQKNIPNLYPKLLHPEHRTSRSQSNQFWKDTVCCKGSYSTYLHFSIYSYIHYKKDEWYMKTAIKRSTIMCCYSWLLKNTAMSSSC